MPAVHVRKIVFLITLIGVYVFRLATYETGERSQIPVDQRIGIVGDIVTSPDVEGARYSIVFQIMRVCDVVSRDQIDDRSCREVEADGRSQMSLYMQSLDAYLVEPSPRDGARVDVGDRVTLIGSISRVNDCSGGSCTEKEKSFSNYQKRRRVFTEITRPKIVRIEPKVSHVITRSLIDIRVMLEQRIDTYTRVPYSDLAKGLVISGKGSMSDDLLEDFKKVGLIHIVVLSGSNVSIISVALFSLLSKLPLLLRSIIGVASMTMFAIMTGAAPPVVRSVCMTTVPIVIELIRQFRNKKEYQNDETHRTHVSAFIDAHASVYSLVCIGLVLAILNPLMLIYDMSFQLSFMATFGLMSLSGVMSRICSFLPQRFGIREIVSCSLATQVFVLPLLLLISDEVSLVFLIANILVLPVLPLTMLLVFVTMLSSFIMYPIAVVSGHVSWIFLKWIMWVSSFFSGFRFSTMTLTLLTPMEVVVIFMVLAPLSLMIKYVIVTK